MLTLVTLVQSLSKVFCIGELNDNRKKETKGELERGREEESWTETIITSEGGKEAHRTSSLHGAKVL